MRIGQLFGRTLYDAPAEAELVSHKLALRAGMVRPLTAGVYAWLPLGWRVIGKIAAILREEMDALGAQEVSLPIVQPAEVLQQTGRWDTFGPELLKVRNRDGRDFALGPTHEDVVAVLTAHEIESYRDLPKLIYQIRAKYRDTARPRGGLVRLREFTMKDTYSLDRDFAALDAFYPQMLQAYHRVFERVGVPITMLEADTGAMGGASSHEFALIHPQGEALFARCDACGYAANVEVAQFVAPDGPRGEQQTVSKIATPDCKTIQELADLLHVPTSQTLKAVFFVRDEQEFVFAVIRGDLEVNEVKLANAAGGGELRTATEEEIRAVGAVPGYASPSGLKVRKEGESTGVTVIVDRSVQNGANFVAGANDEGYHLTGVNYPRDFQATRMADVAEAFDGATCGKCGTGTLHIEKAIELGHCFKLGTRYSQAVGAVYKDERGQEQPVVMGSYGIGLERLAAAIIETHHDDQGIIWPRSVAPFDVHIVTLGKEARFHEQGGALHDDLRRAGIDALLDDRLEGAGVKFADADLIGIPLRITISQRAVERGAVEGKWRDQADRFDIPLANAVREIVRLARGG